MEGKSRCLIQIKQCSSRHGLLRAGRYSNQAPSECRYTKPRPCGQTDGRTCIECAGGEIYGCSSAKFSEQAVGKFELGTMLGLVVDDIILHKYVKTCELG